MMFPYQVDGVFPNWFRVPAQVSCVMPIDGCAFCREDPGYSQLISLLEISKRLGLGHLFPAVRECDQECSSSAVVFDGRTGRYFL